jgi:dipeptidyl aminopeptidase/acylaminoacyl peptidase
MRVAGVILAALLCACDNDRIPTSPPGRNGSNENPTPNTAPVFKGQLVYSIQSRLFSLKAGKLFPDTLVTSNALIKDTEVSSTGLWVAYRTSFGVTVLELANAKEVDRFDNATSFAWADDGNQLAYAEKDAGLYLYAVNTEPQKLIDLATGFTVTDIAFSPDANQIAYLERKNVDSSFEIKLLEDLSKTTVKTIASGRLDEAYPDDSVQLQWYPDGTKLIYRLRYTATHPSLTEGGIRTIGELTSAEPKDQLEIQSAVIDPVKVSADGSLVVYASGSTVSGAKIGEWKPQEVTTLDNAVTDLAWFADTVAVAMLTSDGVVLRFVIVPSGTPDPNAERWPIRFDPGQVKDPGRLDWIDKS